MKRLRNKLLGPKILLPNPEISPKDPQKFLEIKVCNNKQQQQ